MEQVAVSIKLNKYTGINRTVPEYEIPILSELFDGKADAGVTEGERSALPPELGDDGKALSVDQVIDNAYMRLSARYNTKDGEEAFRRVYPDRSALARVIRKK